MSREPNVRDGENKYEIIRRVGENATAETFEASDGASKVAIKRYPLDVSTEAFLAGAEAQLALHHRALAQVIDFGISEGRAFLVVEQVEGRSLVALESQAEEVGEPFPKELAIEVIATVADALDQAHHALDPTGDPRPIIHGDIGPEAIWVSPSGEVKLTDLGIAPGQGKPGFTAPERSPSPAADVYALAATLRWMLGDEPPLAIAWILSLALDQDPALRPSAAAFSHELRMAHATHRPGATMDAWLSRLPNASAVELSASAATQIAMPKQLTGSWSTTKTKPPQPKKASPSAPVPPPSTSLIGTVLHGFRIIEALAHRPGSSVYRARHLHFDRTYAVKVLHAERAADADSLERFKREAVILSRLEHPSIVRAADFGVTPSGEPFIVMDLVEGRTLDAVVKSQGPLSVERAAWIGAQIASALDAAHHAGLVHRDVKPSNVMLVGDAANERVMLIDFGIARVSRADARDRLTATGQTIGTPAYMAPEQIVGLRNLGPPTDLYGLGALLYFAITGAAPFGSQPLIAMHGHLYEDPPRIEDPLLGPLIAKLLAKSPADRPADARTVMAALEPKARPRRRLWWLLAATVPLLGAAWVALSLQKKQPVPTPKPATSVVEDLPAPGATPRSEPPPPTLVRVGAPIKPSSKRSTIERDEVPAPPPPAQLAPPPEIAELRAAIARLRPKIERLAAKDQVALDRRYLDLRSAIRADLGDDERRSIGRAIDALGRDIDAVVEHP